MRGSARQKGWMFISNVTSSEIEKALASMEQVDGYRGLYTISTSQPMSITRIRVRPFQPKRRICKVRIPKQKDGRSTWPQQ